jgi:hypothetical protein
MYDPTGDIPWDEEAGAEDVVHVESEQVRHVTSNYIVAMTT